MTHSVLLTYASSYGSTQEVAEAVAETLRGCGLKVDLVPAREVRSVAGYDAVVLGAPLYMFHWHKAAKGFLSRYHDALANVPVAIFALGPIGAGDEQEFQAASDMLDKELAIFPWLTPVTVEMFGGKLDPEHLHFPTKIFMSKMPPADLRDWNAIRTWATHLPDKLH